MTATAAIPRKLDSDDLFRQASRVDLPPGEFIDFGYVPVFDEHEAVKYDDDGNPIKTIYDRDTLVGMADTMNERIADTGDFAVISAGHTPENPDDPQPPAIGFMGPWKVEKFGNINPRWCIVGRYRIKKQYEREARERPRRSVEMLPHDDPKRRYFDPVALLGSESPRRALGLVYSAARGMKVERYSMASAMPSGSNTFVPSAANCGPTAKKKEKYTESPAMAFSPDDLLQIVEALKPVIKAMVDEATLPEIPEIGDEMSDEVSDGLQDTLGDDPAGDAGDIGDAGEAGDSPLDANADGVVDSGEVAAGDAEAEAAVADDAAATADEEAAMAEADEAKESGSDSDVNLDDDPEKNRFDGDWNGQTQNAPQTQIKATDASGKKEKNMADPANVDKYAAERDKLKTERDTIKEKYRKLDIEHRSLAEKYKADQEKLATLQTEFKAVKREQVKAERYAALTDLSNQGYVFDVDEELAEVVELDDAGYEKHLKRIEKYTKVPIGRNLPIPKPEKYVPKGDQAASEKYSIAAKELVLKERKEGREMPYAVALQTVMELNGSAAK